MISVEELQLSYFLPLGKKPSDICKIDRNGKEVTIKPERTPYILTKSKYNILCQQNANKYQILRFKRVIPFADTKPDTTPFLRPLDNLSTGRFIDIKKNHAIVAWLEKGLPMKS